MSKRLSRIALLSFALCLIVPMALASANSQYGSLVVYPADAPLVIDGFADDWNVAGLEPTLKVDPEISLVNEGFIASADQLSADLYLLHDDEYLYVAAKVVDDNVVGAGADDGIWRNSVVELWFSFSGTPANPAAYDAYTSEDYQINLTPMSRNMFAPQSWVYPAAQTHHNTLNPVEVAASEWSQGDLKGYIIEARIPKAKFPGVEKVAAGNTIRFAVSMVHNDKIGMRAHVWSPSVDYLDVEVR